MFPDRAFFSVDTSKTDNTPGGEPSGKRRFRTLAAGCVLLAFFLAFAGLTAAYIYKFDQQLSAENRGRLSEVSNYIAAHMSTVVLRTQESLRSVSKAVALLGSDRERMEYLEEIAAQYSFAYMGYAGPDGMLRATVASESTDVSRAPYFRNALRGKATVSDQVRRVFAYRAAGGILLAVPMRQGERPGMLVAMLETKTLKDALGLESFGGAGYSYIIDTSGAVVMRTKSLDFGNLFLAWKFVRFRQEGSLERFMDDVAAKREGLISFDNMVGVRQYAYYRPLPFNNWTVVNIVSEQAVFAKTVMLTRELAVLGCVTVLVFMGLMYWAMRSYRLSQESRLAAEAKSAFLANMSHEIRTPMNAIVGMSEIMLRDEVTPRHREQLLSILNSGKGLLTIINDILDISKIEAGGFTFIKETYALESLLYNLTIIVALRIGEKPVEFLVELAPGLPRELVGDMGRVKQVLLNIVGNAIKFTDRGSIRLRIDAAKDEHGWLLRAEVRDTGIGIKEKDLNKLFVSFTRVDARRNRNVEGTGLGLAISRKLCGMMGGHIGVASEYGKGSAFTLTLRQGAAGPSPMIRPVQGEVSLLVCENSPIMREFESSCMDRLGLPHIFCATGEEFEAKLREGRFTHALAPRAVLRRISDDAFGHTRRIGLLALGEHALIDAESGDIYLPLFAVQLPSALNGAMEHPDRAEHSGVDAASIEPMPHVSVLTVDDNELNIMVAEGLMEPYGMRMDHVYSGKEAILAVRNRDYDLVLMDHMMPEMDGVEAVRLIRELPDEKYRKLPIVALTANATSEARRMFLEKGFNEFLAKPIDTHKLHKVLETWLREANAHRAVRS